MGSTLGISKSLFMAYRHVSHLPLDFWVDNYPNSMGRDEACWEGSGVDQGQSDDSVWGLGRKVSRNGKIAGIVGTFIDEHFPNFSIEYLRSRRTTSRRAAAQTSPPAAENVQPAA